MKSSVLLTLFCLGPALAAFKNGPGSSLTSGKHTDDYVPILELSEDRIAAEVGDNGTALTPYVRDSTQGVSPNREIFKKRQTATPVGAVTCSASSPCVDGTCCGSNNLCGYKEEHCGAGCQSNCEARAMCGVDSASGSEKCGLNLCCSYFGWCGTKDVHCIDAEPDKAAIGAGVTPCQEGMGSCEIKSSPECGEGSGTASGGKKIAYYAGWNSRERQCDKVYPANINTKGLTHLMYSFAGFDPNTFEVVADPDDIPLYPQFTKLGSSTLKTWIAIGGWKFNDPDQTTFTAFSDMVNSSANRAKFIKSLITFMDKYGFTGADIDWEYPSEAKRGGTKADKLGLVELMKDMRAAFGTKYGLSVVLAPDYWYLQGFAPKLMEPYVDHMGFMAYDLHGPWDSENALGNRIRPHTDIRDIDNGLTPLWFDGVTPSKIVMGLAYYGRTFTAASSSCPIMGCPFSGPGKPYGCTNAEGVLSNVDIRKIIKEKGVTPELLEGAMVKELVFDNDQWVAYDDEETIALKTAFANKRCLGGTMIWSIDYDSPSSSTNPDGSTPTETSKPTATALPAEGGPSGDYCIKDSPGREYTCVKCTDTDVDSSTKYPDVRWKAAMGDQAIEDHNKFYDVLSNGGGIEQLGPQGTYVRSLSWMWDGPKDWECKIGAVTTCNVGLSCGMTGVPAASMIMTSWTNLRAFYDNQYNAIQTAGLSMAANAAKFSSTFSPEQKSGDEAFGIMVDLLGEGFSMVNSAAWGNILKNADSWMREAAVDSLISAGTDLAKDKLAVPDTPIETLADVSAAVAEIVDIYREAIDSSVKKLFGGGEEGRKAMAIALQDGKWLDSSLKNQDLYDMTSILQRTLYGMLLTKTWGLKPTNHPYILLVDEKDHTGNPTSMGGATTLVSDSDIATARVAIGDQTFYLLNYQNCLEIIPDSENNQQCVTGDLTYLPGLGSLAAEKSIWNVKKDDIVTSAVEGWKLNGNKNGYEMPENSKHIDGSGNLGGLIFENGIRTPGFFNFPICDFRTATVAWYDVTFNNEDECDTFPCC
ncbi:class III chitinase [Phlyctema vagabunda]|uniref:chitinase n=1 Tax=Phlyctema vagabunda TaxID=108571 RepID=A0ABR4P4B8_9HELO